MKLLTILNRAVKSLEAKPTDEAAIELARWYARELDNAPGLLITHGRAFRETLETLGMTPKARAAMSKGEVPKPPVFSALDELRAQRERRGTA